MDNNFSRLVGEGMNRTSTRAKASILRIIEDGINQGEDYDTPYDVRPHGHHQDTEEHVTLLQAT